MWNCTHEIDTYGYPLPLRGGISLKKTISVSLIVCCSPLSRTPSHPHLTSFLNRNQTLHTTQYTMHVTLTQVHAMQH